MHWSDAYLSQPWQKRGRERGGLDCLGLARLAVQDQAAIPLPAFGDIVDDEEVAYRAFPPWAPVPLSDVQDFDILVFGHGGIEDHIGIVAGGQMLHIEADGESVVESFRQEKFQRRFIGAYRHVSLAHAPTPTLRPFIVPDPDRVTIVGLSLFATERDVQPKGARPGVTLAEAVSLAYPEASKRQREGLRVSVGWMVFPPEQWGLIRPKAGSVVTIQPLPGFNWKAVLSVVVAVAAIAAGQYYAAPLIAASGISFGSLAAAQAAVAVTQAAITAGVMVGGNLLLNSLFAGKQGTGSDSPVFALQGWQNQPRPDEPFPFPFGKRPQAPAVYARQYMVVGTPDTNNTEESSRTSLRTIFVHGIIGPDCPLIKSEERIGDTDIEEFYGRGDFDPVTIETLEWYPGDPPPSIYDHQVIPTDDMGAGVNREEGEPAEPVTRVAAKGASSLEIILRFPGGLIDFGSDGEAERETAIFTLEQQEVGTGTWTTVRSALTVEAERAEMFWFSYTWAVDDTKQYRVRLTRNDDPSPDDKVRQDAVWEALYAHRPESPMTSKVPLLITAIEVRASQQLQGIVDSYNCMISRACKDWNGSAWVVRETSNPASAFRLAHQGPQLMKPKPDSKLDLLKLQEWHEDCTDWGIEFNYELTDKMPLPSLREFIAQAGRASAHNDGKKWGVIIDKPRSVINGGIGAHNSIEGSFGKQKNVLAQRFDDAWRVKFFDDENDYKQAERIVRWPGFVGEPSVFGTLDLPWVTNADQAWIEARRRMHRMVHRPRTMTCSQDWEHLTRRRGDRMLLNHRILNEGQVSARVVSVDGLTLEIDSVVEMEAGGTYGVVVLHVPAEGSETADSPAIAALTRTVVTAPGKTKVLQLTQGVDAEYGDVVLFGGTVDAIIKTIQKADKHGAQLVFEDYAPAYYAAVDAEVPPPWDGDAGEVPDSGEAPPALSAAYMFNVVFGEFRGYGRFSWTSAAGKSYQVGYRKVGTTVVSLITTAVGASQAVTSALPGADDYEGRIRVVGSSVWSAWVPIPNTTVLLADADTVLLADDGTVRVAD